MKCRKDFQEDCNGNQAVPLFLTVVREEGINRVGVDKSVAAFPLHLYFLCIHRKGTCIKQIP